MTAHPDHSAEVCHLERTIQGMVAKIFRMEEGDMAHGADEHSSLVLDDKARLEAQSLSAHLDRPYFGNLLVRAGGKERILYLGEYPFADPLGGHSVSDWRSPVGQLFYNDETSYGKATVLRKRQLEIQRRTLNTVTDLYDTTGGKSSSPAEAQVATQTARDEVLVRRLSEKSTGALRSIVATLQPEQYAYVSAPPSRPLLIQGPAGSGKSSVLAHRLAWLSAPDRNAERIDPTRTLVLMPNEVLVSSAARASAELGLQGLSITTSEKWMLGEIHLHKAVVNDLTLRLLLSSASREQKSLAWLRAKTLGQAQMFDVAWRHLLFRTAERARTSGDRLSTDLGGKRCGAELIESLTGTLAAGPIPTGGLKDTLISGVFRHIGAYRETDASLDEAVAKFVNRVAGPLPITREVRSLCENPEILARACQGVLDDKHVNLFRQPNPLKAAAGHRNAVLDITELPLALALERAQNGSRRDTLDYLAIDEAHDLSPLFFRLAALQVPKGRVTAAGDLLQGISGFRGLTSWEGAMNELRTSPEDQISYLSRTYRSSEEITALSRQVAASYARDPALLPESVPRSGGPVQVYAGESPLVERAVLAVRTLQGQGHAQIALILRSSAQAADFSALLSDLDLHAPVLTGSGRYDGGVICVGLTDVKGSEFDAAVLIGADETHYASDVELDRRLLYVGVTRALHALALVPDGALHPLLSEPGAPLDAITSQVQGPLKARISRL